ncbi:hypothetical protein D187_004029 [Cystobacter fuscus DSM 2262]|uniref:Uncharacterized protein n=1 Tax=Cystobacter fuscus (strain ATCC 25194 / DSM 2262 / NBRC 100088 / M29) TaxID=1242864 RepID=S9QNY8_CYSF2|nr:hypothetical protein D187_004029 [Cystobacter fuscus DSM 2262]
MAVTLTLAGAATVATPGCGGGEAEDAAHNARVMLVDAIVWRRAGWARGTLLPGPRASCRFR